MTTSRPGVLDTEDSRPHTGYMTTSPLPNVSHLREGDVVLNQSSFKTKAVALRRAKEWANWNAPDHEVEAGEVFEVQYFNGGYHVPVWLAYTVSVTDEGYTVTSHRWYSNPTQEA